MTENCCAYCGKPLAGQWMTCFKDKLYHVRVDEHGSPVRREWTCWGKSEQGTKTWIHKESV
jgi:hypothetical protein